MGVIETKTFKSGNSVAVRLPRELGIGADTPVTIEPVGDGWTLRLVKDADEEKRQLLDLIETLRALGPIGEVQKREPIEFPDRPGLY